jgi:hypothetical protein
MLVGQEEMSSLKNPRITSDIYIYMCMYVCMCIEGEREREIDRLYTLKVVGS